MSVRDFNRDNRGSSGNQNFGRRDFGGRNEGRPMLHKTICSKCGKECEVPFRPSGSRPVFCRECFQSVKPSESMRPDSNFPRRSSFQHRSKPTEQDYREQFEALNVKLDKILRILEPKIITEVGKAKIPKVKKISKQTTPIEA